MNNEYAQLLLVRGTIASLPADQQSRIKECGEKIKAVMAEYPDGEGMIAMALIGAELTQD